MKVCVLLPAFLNVSINCCSSLLSNHVRSKALFIGIRSDFLFPAALVYWLAEQVSAVGGDATYVELDSPHGHDAFPKEWEQMNNALNVMKE